MRTESVLTAAVSLGQSSYREPARRVAFFEELEARLRRLPGVTEVAISDSLPPGGGPTGSMLYAAIDVEGRPRMTNGTGGTVAWRSVTPAYFAALGIPILRGRGFHEEDRGPNRGVVILSDTLARRMFPGEDPLVKRIQPGRNGPWLSVIGVAGNVKNAGLFQRDDPEYYLIRKHAAAFVRSGATAILRTALEPGAMARTVRAEVAALDPTLPVNIETLEQRVGRLAARPRFNAVLLGIFASMGMLLAAIGLYGVVSFLVAQRVQEIGVRMALGATPAGIVRLVLGQAGRWTAAGALAGAIGSLLAARSLRTMLFQVSPNDPWMLAAASAALFLIALAAAWAPSRRAARVDPVEALRQE
jgi:predicted permease